jgi:hypothetical protein
MSVPAHLTIKLDGLAFDRLLADWRWLVQPSYRPVLMTAFGDLFLRDETGHVHFLDLMAGDFKQVATSEDEFYHLCEDRERRRRWFISFLIIELRKIHGDLASRECYGCKTPLTLGGQLEVENFERTNLQTHYSVLGQLQKQVSQMPPGTKVDSIKIKLSGESEKPKGWWQRVFNPPN